MLIKNILKLFSCANRNRNRLLYFSTNCCLQTQYQTFPSLKYKIGTHNSYYLNYLMSKTDHYCSVYDTNSLFTRNESDPEAIKLLLNFDNIQDVLEKENCLNEVLKCLQNELSNYSVDEFCKIIALVYSHIINNSFRNQLIEIKNCIDKELLKKCFSKSESMKLLFTLSSVPCKNYAFYYFQYKTVLKLLNKIHKLSIQEIVQIFFCIPKKDFSKTESKFFILSHINEIISELNPNELGIIAQGLAKGKMTFNHKDIFTNILNKTREEIDNIPSVPFLSTCEVLRKSFNWSTANSFMDFQEKLIPHVSKLDKKCLLSLVYAGHNFKVLHSSLKEILIKKWKECIMDFNYSEIMRLIHMTVAFNIQDEELLLSAIKNLEHWDKHQELTFVLNNLSFHGLYPKKLLEKVFSDDFFKEVCKNKFLIKSKTVWWSLYCNVKLEKPEYCKEFNSSSLNSVYKKSKVMESVNADLKRSRFYPSLYSIEKMLGEIYGESKVFITNVLPHFSSGIVMRFNKELQAQEIPEVFRSSDAMSIKKTLQDNNFWIFVLVLKKSDFLWNTDTLSLCYQTQCRQLKALGYEILTVKLSEFLLALKENNERKYIADLMNAKLENISDVNK